MKHGLILAASAAFAAGSAWRVPAHGQPSDPAVIVSDAATRCASLDNLSVPPSAFALPTGRASVSEAIVVVGNASDGAPEYCRIRASIAAVGPDDPAIIYQINLPSRWNEKTVQYGGGGTNGVLVEATGDFIGGGGHIRPALHSGYVTYGSDSGHQGRGAEFYENPQAFANYAYEAVKRTKDLTAFLVRAYYGREARRNYHIGHSKGGQEALQAAQRYPEDFDGVVAYNPAQQNQSLTIGWNRLWSHTFGVPGATLDIAEQAFVTRSMLSACDALDNAKDGIVSNVKACEKAFKVERLRCSTTRNSQVGCLSEAQIDGLRAGQSEFRFAHPMPNQVTTVGPFPVLTGGDIAILYGDGTEGSQQAFYRQQASRLEALNSSGVSKEYWLENVAPRAIVYDASSPNVDEFAGRGAKLILVQGTTDMLVPPAMTTRYFQTLLKRYGTTKARTFARYYLIPGFGHGSGVFKARWDALAALDRWVEAGRPPWAEVVEDGNSGSARRTRPLCEYPAWPKYLGRGALDSASSFACATR